MRSGEPSEYVLTPFGRDLLEKVYAREEEYVAGLTGEVCWIYRYGRTRFSVPTIVPSIANYRSWESRPEITRRVQQVLYDVVTIGAIKELED